MKISPPRSFHAALDAFTSTSAVVLHRECPSPVPLIKSIAQFDLLAPPTLPTFSFKRQL